MVNAVDQVKLKHLHLQQNRLFIAAIVTDILCSDWWSNQPDSMGLKENTSGK